MAPTAACGEKQTGFTLDQARHQAEISLERLGQVGAFYGMSDEVLAETRTLLRTEEHPAGRVVNRQAIMARRFTSSCAEAWNC
jgi:hypothetical protein